MDVSDSTLQRILKLFSYPLNKEKSCFSKTLRTVRPKLHIFSYYKVLCRMYHRQQNKCYPKVVYLPISKLHSILVIVNLLAHNNKSQFCYCGQISLQSAAANCSFSDNLTPLGGGNSYFAGDGTYSIFIYV